MGNPHSRVRLDVFYDLHCVDSRNFNREFMAFLDSYYKNGTFADAIDVVFHYYPLPYHRLSFRASVLAPYLAYTRGDQAAIKYAAWTLEHFEYFVGEDVKDLNENEVMAKICRDVSEAQEIGLEESECLRVYDENLARADTIARKSYTFAAYSDVTGTPTVRLNGIEMYPLPMRKKTWVDYMTVFLS